ncbi:flagellar hook-associated protein FlgL [Thiomicrorhabdus cannonii]|uniref:flagellar hook-associated protein FlgL n=1 Tax=Thiomicrorhabdus cannonii TaxID=2748011 RepID=UPI0015BFA277|nr:flagellar hook-associated protein FlgL [Thiomicrorhabdus cannonii]
MRISTNMFHSQGISSIQNHQKSVMDTQLQLSTGKRVNAPGDDPVATSQIHALNRTMNTIEQYAKNGEYAKSQLVLEETAIADTIGSLQRARELAIQMSNGTYTAADREATAAEVDQIIQQVKSMMNYRNSEGELIFAGSSVNATQAFVEDVNNPGYYAYIGGVNSDASGAETTPQDPLANYGSRFVQIGFDDDNLLAPDDAGDPSRVRITDNGNRVFSIPGATLPYTNNTGGGTPEANVLNVLVEFKNTLLAGNTPSDEVIGDMDSALTNLSQIRAEIGGRQNRIQSQYEAGESFKVALEERRMTLEDMDLVAGVTELTKSQNALQMAQQVFTKVQGMSLFNYLR